MAFGDEAGPSLKVCCGPRCGQEPGHRAIYAAVESASPCPVRPSGCLGHCRGGVTVLLPDGQVQKVQSVDYVRKHLTRIYVKS